MKIMKKIYIKHYQIQQVSLSCQLGITMILEKMSI